MSVERVLDTNVLVYAVPCAPEHRAKQARALELIAEGEFGLSGQILQEFYMNVTRQIRVKLTPADALKWIDELAAQSVVSIDARIVKRGAELSETWRVSYWDGAILASAEALGVATTLCTEDLNNGQLYGTVRAVNPFAGM